MSFIYKLTFKGLEDFPYIGKTENVKARYASHLSHLKLGEGNFKMLEAYEMSGAPSVEVLEECLESEVSLKEQYWIKYYDSINNGLNVTEGGSSAGSGTTHACSKYTREQLYKVFNMLGEVSLSYKDIEAETGVHTGQIYAISKGIGHVWLQKENPTIWEKIQNITNRGIGINHYNSRFNEESLVEVFDLLQDNTILYKEIERITGVSIIMISGIKTGKSHTWLQDKFPEKWKKIQELPKKGQYTIHLVSPNKVEYNLIGTPTEVSKILGLDSSFASGLSQIFCGRQKTVQGWKIISFSKL